MMRLASRESEVIFVLVVVFEVLGGGVGGL